uniref:Uncharacterized protein n=1 Tax=Aegilops tauschii subsp. strangulata TaxID=200361 RepID=A0A453H9A4_AEGTS
PDSSASAPAVPATLPPRRSAGRRRAWRTCAPTAATSWPSR